MKTLVFVLCLWVSCAARADLLITEVMSSSSHANSAANGDWWELYNSGDTAIDLSGYSWDDSTAISGSAFFGGLSIGAGQAIIICQEALGAEQSWTEAWGAPFVTVINLGNTEFQNFSSSGDEIHVYNSSGIEMAACVFGAATSGFSFEWDSTGNSLGLSALGENGAFQATSLAGDLPDIGSPGVVYIVPEPGVLALSGLGCLGWVYWRKKAS